MCTGPRRPRRGIPPGRPGFTLIELLVVIVVIALLAALLLPAIGQAVGSAKNAQVTAEMNQMAQALADFKTKYGDYPPSRIILSETGDYSSTTIGGISNYPTPNATDQPILALSQRSTSFLRKFWPRFQVSTTGAIYNTTTGWPDFNGNGPMQSTPAPDLPVVLSGDECLVWFLGGMPQPGTGGTWGMTGTSRSPINPFQSALNSPANRVQPFFEFKSSRLVDLDGDGYPSYLDPLGTSRPYVYFSAYGGGGYDPNDVNFDVPSAHATASSPIAPQLVESDDAGSLSHITLQFLLPFPVPSVGSSATAAAGTNVGISPSPNPYTTTLTNPSNPALTTPTNQPPIYLNPQTFQILSAGGDGLYGFGGQYLPNSPSVLPYDSANSNTGTNAADKAMRSRESDNLSNFATSRLGSN